ncbi:MAG: exo-alpha-sialidase [Roseovarius sp.]|nr:exo-alpha-sialidase [Roseovarius sp.]
MTLAILALAVLSLGLSAVAIRRDRPLCWRFALPDPLPATGEGRLKTVLDHRPAAGQAHAPAIIPHEDGFAVIWFQGSAEAQPDVDIWGVDLVRQDGDWQASRPTPRLTRADLGKALEPRQLVVTLGNTVAHEATPGRLFATVVSVGGWAMAAIADVTMSREGPVSARKLDLSPILNRSFLVKSPMLAYADGSHALPAYFEMGPTFGALVRFDAKGRVRDRRWMRSRVAKAIQPMIVPLDDRRALAFLRDFDRSDVLWLSHSEDGGRSWSAPERTCRANPSAPVAALALGDGRILMAGNDDAAAPDALILSVSGDEGTSWREVHRIEGPGAVRYPMLRRMGDEIVLVHSTGGKRGIAAHVFDAAWLAAR